MQEKKKHDTWQTYAAKSGMVSAGMFSLVTVAFTILPDHLSTYLQTVKLIIYPGCVLVNSVFPSIDCDSLIISIILGGIPMFMIGWISGALVRHSFLRILIWLILLIIFIYFSTFILMLIWGR